MKTSMIGPGEHPADEPCGGLCGASSCMEKALGEMGITYSNGPAKPLTAVDVMAELERAERVIAPIRAELDRITADLFGAIAIAAAKQGISWDEAAERMLSMAPVARLGNCGNLINAAREWAWGRGGGRR